MARKRLGSWPLTLMQKATSNDARCKDCACAHVTAKGREKSTAEVNIPVNTDLANQRPAAGSFALAACHASASQRWLASLLRSGPGDQKQNKAHVDHGNLKSSHYRDTGQDTEYASSPSPHAEVAWCHISRPHARFETLRMQGS